MKRIMTALIFGTSALAFSGAAVSGHGFISKAKVIEAQPLYETVEVAQPVTECWTERVTRNDRRHGSYTAPLAGGIVGGVVGNQFGRGSGKTALTVAGALLGASIGHDHNVSHHRRHRPVTEHARRCETVDRYEEEQQLVGYRVKYRYEGQTYYTETTEHPGKFIPVRVRVSPVNGI
ncbi:MAG: glycine zipper 2TM domain-containing protein [Pseudomonadota bacterium]